MEALQVITDVEATPLLEGVDTDDLWVAAGITVGGRPRGTVSGKPTVELCLATREGQHVLGTTTLALFLTAADTLKAKYGDPRE